MEENEDRSEGGRSGLPEANTSDPDPAGTSVGQLAAELSSPLEATVDDRTIQHQDTYAGPKEMLTPGLESSVILSIGCDAIFEPENTSLITPQPVDRNCCPNCPRLI
jgi:hypothetical protein